MGLHENDEFYSSLFESLKINFDDDKIYNGKYIKLCIDAMIKRIR